MYFAQHVKNQIALIKYTFKMEHMNMSVAIVIIYKQ